MFTTDTETLLAALDTVAVSMATNDTRPVLEAALIQVAGGSLTAVSADGFVLAVVEVDEVQGEYDQLLKAEGIKAAIALMKRVKKNERASTPVTVDIGSISVDGFGSVPTVEQHGTFPQWGKLIPEKSDEYSKLGLTPKLIKGVMTVADRYARSHIVHMYPGTAPNTPMVFEWPIGNHTEVRFVVMPVMIPGWQAEKLTS